RSLNSIFQQWRIPEPTGWNVSGELCSGTAIDATTIDDPSINPGIKCDCSFGNNSTCHITALKVYAMDITGAIPEELWNLTYLTNINLAQNYLTGTLPASIGNLIRMQYLSLGINALSGELPGELGNLTDLRSLSFSTNNFSGSLPHELGNLRKLEQLYFDSSGVSGGIPSTFASLQSLTTVWASDNELTGSIPAFIGNWSKLTTLRFQGNSFEGPIPQTLSNLTSLTDLRISDLSNRSSSLEFLSDMKLLNVLILRNLNLSGSIPTNIGEYQSLSQLDLSFNNLTGQIPDSLFNLSSLAYLSLGNNKLNGTLPAEKSASLVSIDLSYNELSGTFPSWVGTQNLQLNLVANNFTVQGSDSRHRAEIEWEFRFYIVSNLEQYVLTPLWLWSTDSRFAIKCGGPQITSSNQIVYERDNETLGPATYLVNTAQRWAVSNVGLPSGSNNPEYKVFSSSQFTNTLDSELFQTARTSAGSLRYYGLGLDNGNYTVLLQFAEMPTQNSNSWRSLGRRVFDIYIQGNLMLKDFNIRREAGAFLRAVTKEYNVQVTENYLEIHLFWAGKGTCCVPAQGTYGPLISAISATSDFNSTVSNNPPTKKKNRTGLIVGIVVAVAVLGFLSMFVVYYYTQKRKRPPTYEDEGKEGKLDGTLDDGRVVAVKQLSVASHQGKSQFVAEIATISAVQHRNLVKLYGCCIEGDKRLLVYEYLENKSLDQALFGTVQDHSNFMHLKSSFMGVLTDHGSAAAAWNLHENNHEIELVDATLSEFSEQEVKRVIGVALLCTQTSPALRPSMSRVVAMLSGDIEVTTVTTRPGYLTDWKFNDTTSFMGSETITRSDNSHYILSTSTSTADPNYSPVDPSKHILQEIVAEGK
ncbi:hypothetical protein RJ639_036497, partial [Escallonia herrerae]